MLGNSELRCIQNKKIKYRGKKRYPLRDTACGAFLKLLAEKYRRGKKWERENRKHQKFFNPYALSERGRFAREHNAGNRKNQRESYGQRKALHHAKHFLRQSQKQRSKSKLRHI